MELPLPAPPITLHQAKQNIVVRHLEQLSHMKMNDEKPPPESDSGIPNIPLGSESPYDDLVQWSKESAPQIQKAVKNRAFGGPDGSDIQWINALYCLMESATVYLRDSEKVKEAAEAYKREDFESAFKLLSESTKQIEEIAALWGMKFQLLCDLVDGEGSWFWSGPYCSAFYSEDPDAPFVGVVFKGTNPWNLGDILVDVNTSVIQAEQGIVYNTHVSNGVYKGMFMEFDPGRAYATARTLARRVVLQHLLHTQFTVPGVLPPLSVLGDLYTFGCPRIGYKHFAEAMKDNLGPHTGSARRIANADDLVPQVPPVVLFP
ncbi:hypothetical protein RSOLAG22IIIB_09065 [Rhizoctonia solani]|uniref:Fungal lipase-type domain-containing protein n=1 Tax=Rhizoctonia solani TaxID=456999 RepID=A0A0K6FXL3_9AGAM|nr:hypothetical protein RSOLAG22IIIB_09065 [Rhizoctonia solani]